MALTSHNKHTMEHSFQKTPTYIGLTNIGLQKVDGWYGVISWDPSLIKIDTYFNLSAAGRI
jgi:hypothetical protein